MARICAFRLDGVTPYSQSRMVDELDHPKLGDGKESAAEYDERLWREKASVDADGNVVIPAMALKMAVDESIKRLAIQIKGRGKSTYSKYFVAGQICEGDVPIGVHRDEMRSIVIFANSDGVRGSGKRVRRRFPYHPVWGGEARFAILDDLIPKDIFEKAVVEAGKLVGVGRFRPESWSASAGSGPKKAAISDDSAPATSAGRRCDAASQRGAARRAATQRTSRRIARSDLAQLRTSLHPSFRLPPCPADPLS